MPLVVFGAENPFESVHTRVWPVLWGPSDFFRVSIQPTSPHGREAPCVLVDRMSSPSVFGSRPSLGGLVACLTHSDWIPF